MPVPYYPSFSSTSAGYGYSGVSSMRDPGVSAVTENSDTINAKYFGEPIMSNVMALWHANNVGTDYQKVYSCDASLAVGQPVRVDGVVDGKVVLALADTVPHAKVLGFVAYKPTTTSCNVVQYFRDTTTFAGATLGADVYLSDTGTYSLTAGTVSYIIGRITASDEATLVVRFVNETSGFSGHSGVSGFSAYSGISAFSGFSGYTGISGYSGLSGFTGLSGFSAQSPGPSGFSGMSGQAAGDSGVSGYSGTSGYSGVSPAIVYTSYGQKMKTTAEKRNYGVAISTDADLKINLAASTRYRVRFVAHMYIDGGYAPSGNAYKFKFNYSSTSSDSFFTGFTEYKLSSNGYVVGMQNTGGTWVHSVPVATEFYQYVYYQNEAYCIYEGYIQTTGAGELSIWWTSGSIGYHVWMREGSYIEVCDANLGAISGSSGTSGTAGVNGTSGYSGFSGPAGGPQGDSGYSGVSGFSSNSGVSGYSGASGAEGISGYSGYSGAFSGQSGFSGAIGPQGPSGPSGPSGLRGYSGASGATGSQGTSGYSGPAGASGAEGTSGYSGISGFSGLSGTQGSVGTSGYSGLSGPSGLSGTSGYSGYSAESGWSGKSGVSGYSGPMGAEGNSGYSGPSGFSGTVGSAGDSGTSGRSGYSGPSGYSGIGASGFSGTSGYSGFSGAFSGESGSSGTSGRSGYSGISGVSGSMPTFVDTIDFLIDGGGEGLSSGRLYGWVYVPYGCTITGCTILADTDGDLTLDIWKVSYANHPASAGNSICGANLPSISGTNKGQPSIVGWSNVVSSGQALYFYVQDCSCITRALVSLTVVR